MEAKDGGQRHYKAKDLNTPKVENIHKAKEKIEDSRVTLKQYDT